MKNILRLLALILALATFTGCASMEPYEHDFDPDRTKEGPGLFTGEKGEFEILRP